jgi:hypothetical protein
MLALEEKEAGEVEISMFSLAHVLKHALANGPRRKQCKVERHTMQ